MEGNKSPDNPVGFISAVKPRIDRREFLGKAVEAGAALATGLGAAAVLGKIAIDAEKRARARRQQPDPAPTPGKTK